MAVSNIRDQRLGVGNSGFVLISGQKTAETIAAACQKLVKFHKLVADAIAKNSLSLMAIPEFLLEVAALSMKAASFGNGKVRLREKDFF